VMARQLHDPVPSLRLQRPDLSPALEFVVKKALAKDPQKRYQQATEMAADLQAAIQPALAQPAGLRLGGNAGYSDLTVADSSWQPPARTLGTTAPMPYDANVLATPIPAVAPARTPLPMTQAALQPRSAPGLHMPPPAGGAVWQPAQRQVFQAAVDDEAHDHTRTYRFSRRFYFYAIGLVTLVLQLFTLTLTLNHSTPTGPDSTAIVAGVLLGNALNLLALAAIGFTGITRQRDMRGIFQRVLWVMCAGLVISSSFIDFGHFDTSVQTVPFISFIILLLTNIYSIRALSHADAKNEQIEVAPVFWRSALVGALTGLIPLSIILVFALIVPLPAS
ncbi:MAG: hypothetical protein ACRDHW_24450, partial [Ktedonobacteraceae bacterium]